MLNPERCVPRNGLAYSLQQEQLVQLKFTQMPGGKYRRNPGGQDHKMGFPYGYRQKLGHVQVFWNLF